MTALKEEELNLINRSKHEASFRKGDILIHEGAPTSHIVYLKSGLVKEFIKGDHDKEQILQIIKKFSFLGLSSFFGDRIHRYSYAALEDITICYYDLSVFHQLIKQNGAFSYEILVSVACDNLNNFNRFMKQSQKKTYGRIADAILYFSTIIYESKEFEIPFTRHELSEMIGISRESTTRVLTKFHEEGIISLNDRQIQILNLPLLQQISKNG
ncbi:MAG: Crp/Fnr family transcriptional regulator [Bacteroidales bacterium]|nr:Crp/Fnr family transcriptional regulator [Bacteroidales bacterium]